MGRPTILLATSRFADFARESALGYGLPQARIAVVDHPLGGVAEAQIVARADAVLEEVVRLLTRRGGMK